MKRLCVILVAGVLWSGIVYAAPLLSEQQARAKAISIMQGDPYGATAEAVARNIKQVEFAQNGNTRACGAKKRPVWEFHVVVVTPNKDQFDNGVIDGFLALDAQTGKIVCANLPMLN